jgi:Protein of unknown function (DUF2800)
MSEERKHHPFSPSKLQVLEVSPHYQSKQSDTDASKAGTKQHGAVEASVDEKVHLDDPTLADHEAEAVLACKNFRDSLKAKYPGGTFGQEEYLPIDDAVLIVDGEEWIGTTAGYVDWFGISADQKEADIADWKFGLWSVEPAENNLQGMAYLLGLFKKYPLLEKVTVHFAMPHRNEIDSATFKRDQFATIYLRIKNIVARCLATIAAGDNAQCSARIASCLFCGRIGKCKTLTDFVLKVGKKYAPLEVPENVTPSLLSDATQSSLLMSIAQLMQTWGQAVRTQITARVIEDDDWLPDDYILRSRTDKTVKDWRRVFKIARAHGLKGKQLFEALKISMEPINQAISDATPRGQKKDAVKQFNDVLLSQGALEKEEPIYFLERLKS